MRNLRSRVHAIALSSLVAVALAIGCTGDPFPQPGVVATTPEGGTSGTSSSKPIGAAGGSLTTTDGTKIEIPPGALPSDAVITIAADPTAPIPAEVAGTGTPIVLGPEGQKFDKPVKLTLVFAPDKLKAGRTPADLVVLTAPKGSLAFTALGPVTVTGNTISVETTHFSTFVPATVECVAQCSGQASSNGPTSCQCSATCLGIDYSMKCPSGQCTCQNGATGTTDCGGGGITQTTSLFKSLCGFPGTATSSASPSDAGAGDGSTGSNCIIQCGGAASSDGLIQCGCTTTCDGIAYAMDCPNGACTCRKGGSVTKTGSSSCAPSTTCAEFGSICGFPGSCTSGGTDAGTTTSDAGSVDSGTTCTPAQCGGGGLADGGTTCSCSQTCGGNVVGLSCANKSCTCTKNGSTTSTFTGSGTCNDFASCTVVF